MTKGCDAWDEDATGYRRTLNGRRIRSWYSAGPESERSGPPAALVLPADAAAGRSKPVEPVLGGELRSLIAVESLGRAEYRERREAEIVGGRVREALGEHLAAGDVQDRHQVQESMRHRDVGDVGRPDLIRPLALSTDSSARRSWRCASGLSEPRSGHT